MPDIDLQNRLARAEAIEEIQRLKARYSECCDHQYNPEGSQACSPRTAFGTESNSTATSGGGADQVILRSDLRRDRLPPISSSTRFGCAPPASHQRLSSSPPHT